MSPKAVLLKTTLTPLNTVRLVNAAHPKTAVHSVTSKSHFFKQAQSTAKRPFYKQTTLTRRSVHTAKGHYYNGRPRAVTTARLYSGQVNAVRVKGVNAGMPQQDDKGFVDSGCSRHMTGNIAYLSYFKEFDGGYVAFGGGAYGGRITGKGTLKTNNLDFEDAYFVNELKFNLFSVSQMCDKKNYVLFTDTECLVLSPNFKFPEENQTLLKIPRKDNMYSFDMKNIIPKESLTCLIAKATLDEPMLWHMRLGHINFKNINKLVKDNLVRGLPTKRFENDQTCVACLKGKQHRASCKSKVLNLITKPLFMLHMDLFGPTFVSSLMHKKYCLVVIDDYSRFTWVFFLTTKDETSEILKNFIKEIENLVDKKVKIIRSDNGTEFKNKVLDDFCREKGIKREYSIARTPQQNGVAERRNRALIEAARTMLVDSKLPTTFWTEAVSTVCYVQNRVLVVKPHKKTPYELFRGIKPTLSFMRPFGCHATILNTLDSLGKFDGKSDEGFFVEYSLSSKAFRVYNTRTKRVEENLHIGFLENKPMIEGNGPKWLFDIDSLTQSMNYVPVTAGTISNDSAGTSEEVSQDCIVMPIWKDTSYFDSPTKDVENDDSSTKDVNAVGQHVNTASPDDNTSSLKLNVVGPSVNTTSSNEQHSTEDEPKVDLGNITNSYIVPTTLNTRIDKDHPIDNVIGVVKSTVQIRRMTKPTSEQGFLSDVYKQKTHDTLNTYLYACFLSYIEPTSIAKALSDSSWVEAMHEELLQFKLQQVWILVDLPSGKMVIGKKWVFRNKKDERGIVIRNKARLVAHDHRQEEGIDYEEVFAPVARIEAIRLFFAYASFMGFLVHQMHVKSAFLYGTIEEEVYVTQPPRFKDPDHPDKVYKVVKALYGLHQAPRACKKDIFACTGLQVQQKEDGIFISQDKYVAEILKKFNYSDVKSASTPVDLEKPLVKDGDADDVDVHLYRSMIGSLMYLTASRPDIMFAVCACARFQVTPKTSHLLAVKRIFRYLKGKPTLGLWYSRDSPFELVAYTDSDYAGATQDRKSTTGGCQFLGNKLISWQCKKQTVVATSTTEAEYVVKVNAVEMTLVPKLQLLCKLLSLEALFEGRPIMSICSQVGDEAVHKELGDRMEKAATTASSLEAEQDSVNVVRHMLMLPVQVPAAEESDGFAEIIDFLKASSVHYALTVNPIIYTSCIEQFWATAKVHMVNGVRQLQALVDKKRVIITESSIRRDLHLDDAEGTDCLPTATIFEELARMGAKSTAWNEFSCSMASLIICLATNQKFNLSKYIFDAMVKHLDGGVKFLMYLPFEEVGEDSDHPTDSTQVPILDQPSTSSKPKKKQPSKKTQRQEQGVSQDRQSMRKVLDLEKSKDAQAKEIAALKKRIQRLERKKMSGLKRLKKVGLSRRVESSEDQESLGAPEDASKQGRSIVDINADVEMHVEAKVDEKDEHSTKLDDSTAGEAVTTASIEDSAAPTTIEEITLAQTLIQIKAAKPKVVTTAATTTTTTKPKAKGVVVQEPSEFRVPQEAQPSILIDKGKDIMIEPEVPLKRKDQIALDEQIARDIQAKLDAELIEEQKLARK
ncbi:hypothetical protein Tco_0214358 [Tanacetum coccineum]